MSSNFSCTVYRIETKISNGFRMVSIIPISKFDQRVNSRHTAGIKIRTVQGNGYIYKMSDRLISPQHEDIHVCWLIGWIGWCESQPT